MVKVTLRKDLAIQHTVLHKDQHTNTPSYTILLFHGRYKCDKNCQFLEEMMIMN